MARSKAMIAFKTEMRRALQELREAQEGDSNDAEIDAAIVLGNLVEQFLDTDFDEVGAMGLPYVEVGATVQSLARSIVDREEHTEAEVIAALKEFDESGWWDGTGGSLVDELTDMLFSQRDDRVDADGNVKLVDYLSERPA
jgi:hypothetical protein